jgi:hypothetical protein
MMTLAGAAAVSLAELARGALTRARHERDGARAWFLAEAAVTDVLTAATAGTTFTDLLRSTPTLERDAAPGWSYRAELGDDGDDAPEDPLTDANRIATLRVTARGPAPVRRVLEAVIGRAPDPYFPAAIALGGDVNSLASGFLIDGRDYGMGSGCTLAAGDGARFALALPAGAPVPAHPLNGRGGDPSVVRGEAPELDEVPEAEHATRVAAGALGGAFGSVGTPQLTVVDGDAAVTGTLSGAGVLYVGGSLRVTGTLAFTGVVAAERGITVDGGELIVCGGVYAAGDPALDVTGRGGVRASAEALRLAATVAPLPAAARVIAVREP